MIFIFRFSKYHLAVSWQQQFCKSPTEHAPAFPRLFIPVKTRRRTKTKEKAKVVAAAWGAELIQFLAVLAILSQDDLKYRMKVHWDDMKKRMNCTKSM